MLLTLIWWRGIVGDIQFVRIYNIQGATAQITTVKVVLERFDNHFALRANEPIVADSVRANNRTTIRRRPTQRAFLATKRRTIFATNSCTDATMTVSGKSIIPRGDLDLTECTTDRHSP